VCVCVCVCQLPGITRDTVTMVNRNIVLMWLLHLIHQLTYGTQYLLFLTSTHLRWLELVFILLMWYVFLYVFCIFHLVCSLCFIVIQTICYFVLIFLYSLLRLLLVLLWALLSCLFLFDNVLYYVHGCVTGRLLWPVRVLYSFTAILAVTVLLGNCCR